MGVGTVTIKRASKGVGGYHNDPPSGITCNGYERKPKCTDTSCCPPKTPITRNAPKVGRNEPFICGNGRKFKNAVVKIYRKLNLD